MIDLVEKIVSLHTQINTPALIVDLERMQMNIRRMQQLADTHGKKLRPHIKTHKSVLIARQQLGQGAHGITTAKIGEAEVMAEGRIDDIFIANQITHPRKLRKLRQLHDDISVSVGVDHHQQVELYAAHFNDADHPLNVLIEIDCGLQRCGVGIGAGLVNLARAVQDCPGLNLQGIFTHAGQVYKARGREEIEAVAGQEGEQMQQAVQLLQQNHISISTVSVGSTPTAGHVVKNPAVTEIRPGNYVFYDGIQLALRICQPDDCALFVLSTVISQPDARRIVIDAGSKALHLDQGAHASKIMPGFGTPLNVEGTLVRLSEEHGVIELKSQQQIPLGSPVVVLPNHACAVVNLFDYYYLLEVDGGFELVNIDARGKSQ